MAPALRPTIIATAALAVLLTVVVNVAHLDVAYRAPEGHLAVETAGSLGLLLVGYVLLGRFLQSAQLGDLLLAGSLTLLGSTNLVFSVIPAVAGSPFARWNTWALVGGRLVGALGLALCAFARDRPVHDAREKIAPMLVAVYGLLAVIGVTCAFLGDSLPLGIDPSLEPKGRFVVGHAAVLAVHLVAFVAYAAAAVAFLVKAKRSQDHLLGWVALASVLAAAAQLNYFLFPSLYSQWVYVGDFFRAAVFIVLLIGTATEIQRYQRGLAGAVALEERRRLARELHDGLAQELAFIATQSRWLSHRREQADDTVGELVVAAERALDESRSAISALTRPLDEPLDAAVAQAAEDVAARVGVRLKLDLEPGIEVPVATREALVRIVREAVSNTARHGKASRVTVELSRGAPVRLRVADDGIGFDTTDHDGRGFGLTSMSDRARALGAQFRVNSAPGAGTEIEVVLP